MRRPTSGSLANAVSTRPNVSWVDTALLVTTRVLLGTSTNGRGLTGSLFNSLPTLAQTWPAGLSGGKGSHSLAGVLPEAWRSSAICSALSIAAWFSGSPAIGRPQPLIV